MDYLDEFRLALKIAGRQPRTVESYGFSAQRFLRWLDGRPVTVSILIDYQRYMQVERGNRPRAICPQFAGIWAFFEWLTAEKGVAGLPARGSVAMPRKDQPIRRHTEQAELDQLWRAAESRPQGNLSQKFRRERALAMLAVLRYALLRNHELRGLRVADVDLAGKRLHIRSGKGGDSNWVPLSAELKAQLGRYLAVRAEWVASSEAARSGGGEVGLFPLDARRSCGAKFVTNLLIELNQAAGIQGKFITPHCFRHASATELHRNGAPLQIIQRFLRHSNIGTTIEYLHTGADDLHRWAQALTRAPETVEARSAPVQPADARRASVSRRLPERSERRLARRTPARTP